ncbi:His-Xaa-Ser system radical SAM maturase HxsB [Rhizobium sp. AC44/96]|uniref:His-Xaa-Ser system radical SAM maturase HxsB n=1 Tax=Rhizobium sp. AC44/96 TaxID=1841654 RepID=UPI00080FEBAB|nr:His-Xaa-Ser system radical SAM maturase HxsB [Rhizobium sp. AC44/96]OCJ12973.1 His-Xaa-Ser system radical SAM maturase HxsB [Rhizobium sp. AC44/96]
MNIVPLKFRQTGAGELIFCDDAGGYFRSTDDFLERYATDDLNPADRTFLKANGHAFEKAGDLAHSAFSYRWAKRLHAPADLNYVILVPTLRCNLACSYCQVSRVNQNASGHDWDEQTLNAVIRWLGGLTSETIKIEFQGGEPLLRLDVLERVRAFARQRFERAEFVVCTNLQEVSDEAWEFLAPQDTFISTSLDPTMALHERNRTGGGKITGQFVHNLNRALGNSPTRVSALPTFDIDALPEPRDVIETYAAFGFRSIYLRPVNHQGFARKRFRTQNISSTWNDYVRRFVMALIEHNANAEVPLEEFYFSHCLRRVLRGGHDNHVDLRNPNIVGSSYVVIDHDGAFYPTDEARMVTRLGQIDLRMGNVNTDIDRSIIDVLNAEAINLFDPDCVHCPYQAFCGVDVIDELSRYGRIDLPRHLTDFCQRHLAIFDLVFELLYSEDVKVRAAIALWSGLNSVDPELAKVHR